VFLDDVTVTLIRHHVTPIPEKTIRTHSCGECIKERPGERGNHEGFLKKRDDEEKTAV
jgi:hypothetical protein